MEACGGFIDGIYSSVQTIIHKCEHHGNVQQSLPLMKEMGSVSRDEPALVRKVHISPRTKTKDLVKMLAEAGESGSFFYCETSSVPTWHERPLFQKEPLLQKKH